MIGRGGVGLISASNFYVPQVNLPGSMARFVPPAGIPIGTAWIGGSSKSSGGLGQNSIWQSVAATIAPDSPDGGPNIAQGIWAGLLEYYGPWILGGAAILRLLMLSRRR
jgi:hypothetical protein